MSQSRSALYLRLEPFLLPVLNLGLALLVSGLIIFSIGENPLKALQVIFQGSFGSGEGLGYTLFYSTNYIFTGLAVAVAYHAGLFNIDTSGNAGMWIYRWTGAPSNGHDTTHTKVAFEGNVVVSAKAF